MLRFHESTPLSDSPPSTQIQHSFINYWLFPVVCCGLGIVAFSLDLQIAHHVKTGEFAKVFRELVENTEPFGHGVGVICILCLIAALDPRWKVVVPVIGLTALTSGIASNLIKLSLGRTRPRELDDFLSITVWETFQSFFPVVYGIKAGHSFPSAHTTTAYGFAVALSVVYPRGRWVFLILATIVGLGRVQSQSHFLSDVCFGAALGWSVGWLMMLKVWPRIWPDFQFSNLHSHPESRN